MSPKSHEATMQECHHEYWHQHPGMFVNLVDSCVLGLCTATAPARGIISYVVCTLVNCNPCTAKTKE